MTTGDYPEGRGVTSFSFLVKEEMLRAKERVKKKNHYSYPSEWGMRYLIICAGLSTRTAQGAEVRRFMPMSSWL